LRRSLLETTTTTVVLYQSSNDDADVDVDDDSSKTSEENFFGSGKDGEPVIFKKGDAPDIDGSIWENVETGRPPQIMVMKQVSIVNKKK
jgi:hypothetical protein